MRLIFHYRKNNEAIKNNTPFSQSVGIQTTPPLYRKGEAAYLPWTPISRESTSCLKTIILAENWARTSDPKTVHNNFYYCNPLPFHLIWILSVHNMDPNIKRICILFENDYFGRKLSGHIWSKNHPQQLLLLHSTAFSPYLNIISAEHPFIPGNQSGVF